MSRQVATFRAEASLNGSLTSYFDWLGGGAGGLSTFESRRRAPCPADGEFSKFYLRVSEAPGPGKSWFFRGRLCAGANQATVNTDVNFTISDSAVDATYTGDPLVVTAGQLLTMQCIPTGTPSGAQLLLSWEFNGANSGESIFAMGGATLNSVTPRFQGVLNPNGGNWASNLAGGSFWDVVSVAPCPGYVTAMYGYYHNGNFAGGSYVWTIYKSTDQGRTFIAQDGTNGTVNTVLTLTVGANEGENHVEFLLRAERGDMFYVHSDRVGSGIFPETRDTGLGIRFLADVPGLSPFCTTADFTRTNGEDEFAPTRSAEPAVIWQHFDDEDRAYAVGGITQFGLKDLHVAQEFASGAAGSNEYVMRLNEVDQTLGVTITGDDHWLEADLVNSFLVTFLDEIDLRHQASGSPPSTRVSYGMVQYFPGTLIVEKVTSQAAPGVEFDFSAPGLTPDTFTLEDGEQQVFSDIPAGVYAVEELTPPAGWNLVSAVTSNGSPVDAIVVPGGETTTATFTNSTCPGTRGAPPTGV